MIGQKRVIDILSNSIKSNKLVHSYIFSGAEGIGKRTLAKLFMQAIMCENSIGITSCGKCNYCVSYKAGIPVDYMVFDLEEMNRIGEDKKKKLKKEITSIGVDEIRKIKRDAIIKPAYSKKKVYIIIDGDKLTRQAQNSLLKILEEPYEYVHIIINVCNIDSIIETVRSRAVEIKFDKYTSPEIKEYLSINNLYARNEMDSIIACSDGIIGKAKKLADSEGFISMRDEIIESTLKIFNYEDNATTFKIVINKYLKSFEDVLNILESILRDMLIIASNTNVDKLINIDKKDIIIENSKQLGIRQIINAQKAIEKANMKLKMNASKKLAIDAMIIEIMEREV